MTILIAGFGYKLPRGNVGYKEFPLPRREEVRKEQYNGR